MNLTNSQILQTENSKSSKSFEVKLNFKTQNISMTSAEWYLPFILIFPEFYYIQYFKQRVLKHFRSNSSCAWMNARFISVIPYLLSKHLFVSISLKQTIYVMNERIMVIKLSIVSIITVRIKKIKQCMLNYLYFINNGFLVFKHKIYIFFTIHI